MKDSADSIAYALGTLKNINKGIPVDFQDKYSRWHDKPCIDGEPKSNNGWIYSAYADIVGLPVNRVKLYECFNNSRTDYPRMLPVNRSPGKGLPPMSRDEILGMDYFNMLWTTELEAGYHWQFCDLPGFEPKRWYQINYLGALWYLLKMAFAQLVMKLWWNDDNDHEAPEWFKKWSHRNALWDAKALWPIGFRLMPQDTWYMLKRAGFDSKISWIHDKYAWYTMNKTIKGGDASGILILWMKLHRLNMQKHPLYKKIDILKVLKEYFDYTDHPIPKRMELHLKGES